MRGWQRCASIPAGAGRRLLQAMLLVAASLAGPVAAAAPVLPATATSVQGFVPAGWLVEQQQAADLNRDGRADAVLLLRPEGPPPAPGTGQSPERLLVVLLRQGVGQGTGWALAGHNSRLVPQLDLATQDDPLANGELLAKRGGFSLSLGLASTAGSYLSAVLVYRFRVERGCVRLIGHDRLQTHRATQETQDLSINFLTGQVLHSSGNAQGDTTSRRRERLASNPRRCLDDLDSALSFQPLGAPR